MSREQVRRDADSDLQAWQTCQRRLDECRKRAEQAERERDEQRCLREIYEENETQELVDLKARLAKVPALVEALKLARDQFAWIQREVGGDNDRRRVDRAAEQGWEETRDTLAVWEQDG